ncbi:MAG: RhuM family protein [Amphritea sp.]
MNNEMLIYEGEGQSIDVRLDAQQETLWLTQKQMSEVFSTTPENVLMHLKNIYSEGELVEKATTKDFLVVRTEGKRQVKRKLKHYNLDAIISVGYRVSSKRAVQFRQWATQRLKEYLVQGYTLDQQRLAQHKEQLPQLEKTLSLFQQNVIDQASLPEAQGLVKVIADYTNTFVLLNQFDSERLPTGNFDENKRKHQFSFD